MKKDEKKKAVIIVPKDEIKDEFDQIKSRLDHYNAHLEKHMSRTALLEVAVQKQNEHFEYRHEATEKRLEDHDAKFNGLSMKMLHFVSIAGGIAALIKLLA